MLITLANHCTMYIGYRLSKHTDLGMPLISAPGRKRQRDLWIPGQPGIWRSSRIARPTQRNPALKNQNKQTKTIIFYPICTVTLYSFSKFLEIKVLNLKIIIFTFNSDVSWRNHYEKNVHTQNRRNHPAVLAGKEGKCVATCQ